MVAETYRDSCACLVVLAPLRTRVRGGSGAYTSSCSHVKAKPAAVASRSRCCSFLGCEVPPEFGCPSWNGWASRPRSTRKYCAGRLVEGHASSLARPQTVHAEHFVAAAVAHPGADQDRCERPRRTASIADQGLAGGKAVGLAPGPHLVCPSPSRVAFPAPTGAPPVFAPHTTRSGRARWTATSAAAIRFVSTSVATPTMDQVGQF